MKKHTIPRAILARSAIADWHLCCVGDVSLGRATRESINSVTGTSLYRGNSDLEVCHALDNRRYSAHSVVVRFNRRHRRQPDSLVDRHRSNSVDLQFAQRAPLRCLMPEAPFLARYLQSPWLSAEL